jgi:hypothetical protein
MHPNDLMWNNIEKRSFPNKPFHPEQLIRFFRKWLRCKLSGAVCIAGGRGVTLADVTSLWPAGL